MPEPETLTAVVDFLKTVMPWLTGGLAGAVLAYLLGLRNARRARKRLSVNTSTVNYTLPQESQAFSDLRVSFDGLAYDQLVYHSLQITNVSERILSSATFVVELASGATALRQEIRSEPLRQEIAHDQAGLEAHQHRYHAQALHPGDSVEIHLLVNGGEALNWYYRGPEDAEIVSNQRPVRGEADREFIQVYGILLLFLLAGAFALFGELIQVLLLVAFAPFFHRVFLRWRAYAERSEPATAPGPIVVTQPTDVLVDYRPGTGESTVSISGQRMNTDAASTEGPPVASDE